MEKSLRQMSWECWVRLHEEQVQLNSRALSAAELSVVAAASRASQPPAGFPSEREPGAFLPWRAQRREHRSILSRLPQDPAAGGPAAAAS